MRRHVSAIVIGLGIVGVLLLYSVTFTVRWQEKALVLTFGKISQVETEPGLKWKWPWEKVVRFDGRIRTFQTRATEIQTSDQQTVIATVYVNWRIVDPEVFYKRFRPTDVRAPGSDDVAARAERVISDWVKESTKVFAEYRLGELVTVSQSKFKLAAVEVGEDGSGGMLRSIRDKAAEGEGAGVEVSDLGIRQFGVPDEVTSRVFERMRADRIAAASMAEAEGERVASTMVAKAQAEAEMIRANAEAAAKDIMGKADAEAAEYYVAFLENPSLARFLRELDTLRATLSERTTVVLDGESAPYQMLKTGPSVKVDSEGVGEVLTGSSR